MKTLYLSDLDGTLLRSDERISEYSAAVINRFVQNGGYFSYATARSIVTAAKVTAGLNVELPVICGNGTLIIRNGTNEILLSNFFTPDEVEFVSKIFSSYDIYPIIYAFIDGKERFSYIERHVTQNMRCFLDHRIGDLRIRTVKSADDLYAGDVFCFVCIDTAASLSRANNAFKSDKRFDCIYQKEVYSGGQSFEILPVNATKANAALQLKTMLGCDRIVAFGDGMNDLSLFSVADEKYAMSNAVRQLKETATAVIDSNDNDGVAKWIEKNAF